MLQGDTNLTGTPRDGVIARRQIAQARVRSLRSDAALRKTFELHADTGPAQGDLDALFAALDADAPGAVDAAHDKANMPLAQEPQQMRDELEAVRTKAAGAAS